MTTATRGLVGGVLLALGYALGTLNVFALPFAGAQDEPVQPAESALSEEAKTKVKAANEALLSAMTTLQAEQLYNPAIKGINAFAVTVGGIDAIADLESGRGVDPETFAGLYAGDAVDEVAQHLGRDEEGRLTYKNRVVRLYPISRLKRMLAERARLAGTAPDESAF